MSRGWTSPIIACALGALVWNCAGGTTVSHPAPTPSAKPSAPPPAAVAPPVATPGPALLSTQSGVYTDDQAAEGKNIYGLQCASCHPGDHVGEQFRRHWGGKLLSNLFGLMVESMPQDNPGSLTRDDYVRVIAYLLKANGMPAGDVPLPTDSVALSKIRLDTLVTK